MADTFFDFELLDSAEDFMDLDLDPMEQEVAAADSAQLDADQDEMAILADYVIPRPRPLRIWQRIWRRW